MLKSRAKTQANTVRGLVDLPSAKDEHIEKTINAFLCVCSDSQHLALPTGAVLFFS
jgi:hypothetical protein